MAPERTNGRVKVFRNGRVFVQAEKCPTCIFRPGNLMSLEPGRVADLVRKATKAQSCIPCHELLDGEQAVCRGYYDLRYKKPNGLLQVAERLGMIEFVGKGEHMEISQFVVQAWNAGKDEHWIAAQLRRRYPEKALEALLQSYIMMLIGAQNLPGFPLMRDPCSQYPPPHAAIEMPAVEMPAVSAEPPPKVRKPAPKKRSAAK